MAALYDTIGRGYAGRRRPDPRIAAVIHAGLGSARSILNVGAGAGSYEPETGAVVALEPSRAMLAQRRPGAAPACCGVAERLPFGDDAVDAAMAVLTVHHWANAEAGLREMRRVARGSVVILTFDPAGPYFWLADYVPQIVELDQPIMPRLEVFARVLGAVRITAVPVPHDCVDGFLGAYWRRPEVYLDPDARAAISTFAKLGDVSAPMARLRADLESGAWDARYGALRARSDLDIGYRLVVADAAARPGAAPDAA